MYRTCNNCRALSSGGCMLDYKIVCSEKRVLGVKIYDSAPGEECPKPKTNKYLSELLHAKSK